MNSDNNKRPTVYAVAGIPASGKTSFIASSIENGSLPKTAFYYSLDAIMEAMPEFKAQMQNEGYTGAYKAWRSVASKRGTEQLNENIAARKDIIYDRTCAFSESRVFLQDLVENGYRLVFYMLIVDVDEAIARAKLREVETGRHIPEEAIRNISQDLQTLLPDYIALAEEVHFVASENRAVQKSARRLR